MKDYKVGDTIYVKDTVVDIDTADNDMTYQGGHFGWFYNSNVVDELPVAEPVKPVLPKDVADELEDAKKSAYNFFGFLRDCNNKTYPETFHFMFYDTVSSDTQIKILSDAWYNGYTVEQVPRYMVYVPGTNKHYLYVKRGSWAKVDNKKATPITPQSINNYLTAGGNRDLYWFTDEEITKFDLQDCEKELVADDSED